LLKFLSCLEGSSASNRLDGLATPQNGREAFRSSAAAAALVCIALALPAEAQGFDFFHRQPSQPAPAAPPADVPGEGPADQNEQAAQVLRINRLEEELRQANGRIEQLENAERRLEDQFQKFRQDVEYRFGERSGEAPSPVASAPAVVMPSSAGAPPVTVIESPVTVRPKRSDAFDPNAEPNAPGAPQPLGTTVPSAPLVRSVPPAGPPLELGRGPTPPAAPTGPTIVGSGVAMLDVPREQFNAALQAFQGGQYQQAEDGFKSFIATNVGHRLTPDALFYIGETYFQRSRAREAAEQYLKVTTDYARSSRAPESMVRLGQALAALGNSEQACATFAEFGKRYPNATQSVKKLAEREMAKDHC
jgi:tol-pal system protein YbgF